MQVQGLLEDIVSDLINDPPEDEDSYLIRQNELRQSLSPEQLAEVQLLCAKKEAMFTSEHLLLELDFQLTDREEQKKELLEKICESEKKVCSAAHAGLMACPITDHSLRGRIRYLKNYVDSD